MSKKVGVTCTTVFHYIHFKGIVRELELLGFEVDYLIYTPYHINNRVERLQAVFEENCIKYQGFEELFQGNLNYDLIMAPYYMPGFQLLDKQIKKVRILYGYAKDAWNYAEWNKGFDMVLSYGPYATKRLQKYTKAVEIGHPRFAQQYLKEVIDINNRVITEKKLVDKKVLVYCPTWADLSSLETFIGNVDELTKYYTVIVKLHHGNVLSGQKNTWLSLKTKENLYLFDEYTNLFDLLQFADVVLSDYSGAIFDAMLFRKPIVLLDTIDESIKDTGAINLNRMANISLYNNTEKENESLDILVRDFLPHIRNVEDLVLAIDKALVSDIPYLHMLETLYAFQDGEANYRAALAIKDQYEETRIVRDNDSSFHILNEELVYEFLENNADRLKIWGAGLSGQILVSWLAGKGYKINKLMDADIEKQDKTFLDYTIVNPEVEKGIIITVTGEGLKSITKLCIEKGLVEGKDFISIFK
ncbi:CDP-glycerol glycerophosphotransferase family protein [Lysinibacillus xylanilyticus]|uniref:CDP-glycerol glycerophosphotransferase family protein n=1 Tax=Lysinibacillus xylanilyticus TaxID=582475 RepID=UPI002B24ACF5|nr:CDP-glycerol glycerophosphotransferase family protein [Lysinibacillus xylanilyticus]MEB2298498.1 CDP-glycerol glycerophosphotransferase family protein [Lysinibacillus xylanilyticus]